MYKEFFCTLAYFFFRVVYILVIIIGIIQSNLSFFLGGPYV